tara:strand:+ start:1098 stop:2294 length:1197 start_codon:yes stop_codon:yes gene_type:complete
MLRVGVQKMNAYPEVRNIIEKLPNASYVEIKDRYAKIIHLKKKLRSYNKLKKIFKSKLYPTLKELYSFKTNKTEDVDLIHLFNSISYGNENWGVTFETIVPCHNKEKTLNFLQKSDDEYIRTKLLKEIKILASDKCKFIIAISNSTFEIQKKMVSFYPKYEKIILNKMHVLHPAQEVYLEQYSKPNINLGINFMFVGSEFFCKGGIEILNVFEKIKDKYKNFSLILVGSLDRLNGRSILSKKEKERFIKIINSNKQRIKYYHQLPNKEVLKLMKNTAHVGLLPTHADTYGYSVLEFQSTGCPVISSNLRSLNEINNDDCGWLIEVPKSNLGEAFSFTPLEIENIQNIIEDQLKTFFINILEKPEIIKTKGEKSLDRIRKNHSPKEFSETLAKMYNFVK